MRFLFFFFAFTAPILILHADPKSTCNIAFAKDPLKIYADALQKDQLEKLTLKQRFLIINSVFTEVISDSDDVEKRISTDKADIVKNVITTTPVNKVGELFQMMGTDFNGFQSLFKFLPFEDMSMILNYTRPFFQKTDKDSKIFDIPYEVFRSQVDTNIKNRGDNLFQSHYTDFCGKVAMVRLWIKRDSAGYRKFMDTLYYTGKAEWNEIVFQTPQSVIDAVNNNDISEDPNQKILFRNPDVNEKMPDKMDMVLYLTLASTFHTFPFNVIDYDPNKHQENSAWAGAAINPETDLLTAMGFKTEKVGDNLRGVSDYELALITYAASDTNMKVMLLVNSSMLDTCSGACKEYNGPRAIENKNFGTHWITITWIDYENDKMRFWEYGKFREISGISKMKEIIAGGIIIADYAPKK
jgi:hypothetical protein